MNIILLKSQKKDSIIDIITSGGIGGDIIMIVLSVLSILTIYILFERISLIKKATPKQQDFMNKIKTPLKQKKVEEIIEICKKADSPISRMMGKGAKKLNKSKSEVLNAMERQGKIEIHRLDKNLANLATISGAAPMIGFLGTVIGMIIAFHEMSNAGGNVNVEMLSQGIYTAMVTTVAGLIVGIIAYISYNILTTKIDQIVFELENITKEILENID